MIKKLVSQVLDINYQGGCLPFEPFSPYDSGQPVQFLVDSLFIPLSLDGMRAFDIKEIDNFLHESDDISLLDPFLSPLLPESTLEEFIGHLMFVLELTFVHLNLLIIIQVE